jgi:hypothetical protein
MNCPLLGLDTELQLHSAMQSVIKTRPVGLKVLHLNRQRREFGEANKSFFFNFVSSMPEGIATETLQVLFTRFCEKLKFMKNVSLCFLLFNLIANKTLRI